MYYQFFAVDERRHEGDGYHARSALGFAALPTGAAVEVEAIFEITTE